MILYKVRPWFFLVSYLKSDSNKSECRPVPAAYFHPHHNHHDKPFSDSVAQFEITNTTQRLNRSTVQGGRSVDVRLFRFVWRLFSSFRLHIVYVILVCVCIICCCWCCGKFRQSKRPTNCVSIKYFSRNFDILVTK